MTADKVVKREKEPKVKTKKVRYPEHIFSNRKRAKGGEYLCIALGPNEPRLPQVKAAVAQPNTPPRLGGMADGPDGFVPQGPAVQAGGLHQLPRNGTGPGGWPLGGASWATAGGQRPPVPPGMHGAQQAQHMQQLLQQQQQQQQQQQPGLAPPPAPVRGPISASDFPSLADAMASSSPAPRQQQQQQGPQRSSGASTPSSDPRLRGHLDASSSGAGAQGLAALMGLGGSRVQAHPEASAMRAQLQAAVRDGRANPLEAAGKLASLLQHEEVRTALA